MDEVRARIARWVHFQLGVDRNHFRDHWASITMSSSCALDLLAKGDWESAARYLRKAVGIYEIWRVQAGIDRQLGTDQFLALIVQCVRGPAAS